MRLLAVKYMTKNAKTNNFYFLFIIFKNLSFQLPSSFAHGNIFEIAGKSGSCFVVPKTGIGVPAMVFLED